MVDSDLYQPVAFVWLARVDHANYQFSLFLAAIMQLFLDKKMRLYK